MHKAARRTLWWGIGLFIFGVVALVALPWLMTGVEASLNFNTVDQTMYFSLIYPASVIIQYGAFPLGSALIAASEIGRASCRERGERWCVGGGRGREGRTAMVEV